MRKTPLSIISMLNYKVAAYLLVAISVLLLIFHTLIVGDIIPENIVWGGNLTADKIVPFESFAIAINGLLLLIGLAKADIIQHKFTSAVLAKAAWPLLLLLLCNTILNPFSAAKLEAIVFTPVTAVYSLCLFRVLCKPLQSEQAEL